MAAKTVSITEVFDANPAMSSYQKWVCFLCFLVTFLDGFDAQVVAVAIPKIAVFLHANMGTLGLTVSASLVGSLVGAVGLGMLADRFGRKSMLVVCSLVFGLFSILSARITTVDQFAVYRFIAGLGLGGALPNALAFGSEYAPSRWRKSCTSAMYAGIPTGAMLSGLVGAWLMPRFGWQSIFVVGGIAGIIIALLIAAFLPESLEFLAMRNQDEARIRKIVARIAPAVAEDKQVAFRPTHRKLPGVPVKNLFTEKRALVTILFWIIMFATLYASQTLVVWIPTFLHKGGATVVQYSLVYAIYNLSSAAGMILSGRLMDRTTKPFRFLPVAYVGGFACFVVFGWFAGVSLLAAALLCVICGLVIPGTVAGAMTLATVSYPADVRGTATGWAYAVGKTGNVFSPMVGGYLLTIGWSVFGICSMTALVDLFCAALFAILGWRVAATARYQERRALDASKMA